MALPRQFPGAEAISFTAGVAVGTGVGTAIGGAIAPRVRQIENAAWERFPHMPPDAYALAEGVAQGQVDESDARAWAKQQGFDTGQMDALIAIANVGPGVEAAFALWRRDLIDEAGFRRALRRAALEDEWINALVKVRNVLLSPAELANARQQGFVDVGRQHSESALQGVDNERADILFELSGLPPGPETAQEALNRGLIGRDTFAQMIREGHTKTKYTDLMLELANPIISASTYAEGYLRRWITQAEMNAGGALSGLTPAQMDLLYKVRGRPATPRQMFISIQRGLGTRADFDRAIAQSNIRPEYADNLWQIRFAYPSMFQIGRLVTAGTIAPDTALTWLHYIGVEPTAASELVTGWKAGKTAPEKDLVKGEILGLYEGGYVTGQQARTMLASLGYDASEQGMLLSLADARRARKFLDASLGRIRTLYVGYRIDRGEAVTRIDSLGISTQARDDALELWTIEREANVRDLTGPQILRAMTKDKITPVDALARLEQIGYTTADAQLLVDSA